MRIDVVLQAIGKDNYPSTSFANRVGYEYLMRTYGVKLVLVMAKPYTVRNTVVRHV